MSKDGLMAESHATDDVWALIQQTLVDNREAYEARDRLMRDHLVNGQLLITGEQYRELRRIEDDKPLSAAVPGYKPPAWSAVPCVVVPEDGRPIDVGNDQVAFYAQKAIWVVSKQTWHHLAPGGVNYWARLYGQAMSYGDPRRPIGGIV